MTYRVLVVTNMPSLHNTDLFDHLAREAAIDLHVIYLTPSTAGRSWEEQPQISHPHTMLKPWPRSSPLYWSPGAIGAARSRSPQVTIVGQYANLPIQVIAPLLRFKGSKVVSWLEPPGVEFSEAPVTRSATARKAGRVLATNLLRRNSDELWSVTEEGKNLYQQLGDWQSIKIMPYFGGLTISPEAERPFVTKEFCQSRPMRVIYAGKMITRKGVDLLAGAILEIRKRSDIHLQIRLLGDGPLYSDVGKMLEGDADVEMLAQVERDQMLSHYQWADVCVMPSRYDGWGMVAIEAAAAGCAVIGTVTSGSARDALAPHGACLLVNPEVEEICEAIIHLHRNPRALSNLAATGRQVAIGLDGKAGARHFSKAIEDLVDRQCP